MHGLNGFITDTEPGKFRWVLHLLEQQIDAEVTRLRGRHRNSPGSNSYRSEDVLRQLEHIESVQFYVRAALDPMYLALSEVSEYHSSWMSEAISEMEVEHDRP